MHSVVTSTRCAPLTQITQAVDMPHRPESPRPTAQSHTHTHLFPFMSHVGSSASWECLSCFFFSNFLLPIFLGHFFLIVFLLSLVKFIFYMFAQGDKEELKQSSRFRERRH